MRHHDHPDADSADWEQIGHALADLSTGIRRRWAVSGADLEGKRATRHGRTVDDLTAAIDTLTRVVGESRFATSPKAADEALGRALAGPLAALGEDLRVGFRDSSGRGVRDGSGGGGRDGSRRRQGRQPAIED